MRLMHEIPLRWSGSCILGNDNLQWAPLGPRAIINVYNCKDRSVGHGKVYVVYDL